MGKRIIAMLLAATLCVTLSTAANPQDMVFDFMTGVARAGNAASTGEQAVPAPEADEATVPEAGNAPVAAVPEADNAPVAAAPEAGNAPVAAAPATEATAAATAEIEPVASVDDGGAIDFGDVNTFVHENNLTVRANQHTYDAIQKFKNNDTMYALERSRSSLDSMVSSLADAAGTAAMISKLSPDSYMQQLSDVVASNLGATIGLVSSSMGQIESQLSSISDTAKDVKKGKEQTAKQFAYVADQLSMGAETLFITINSLELQQKDLQRNLNAIDRSQAEMQKRVELGQVAELQLAQIKNQRAQLATSIETLKVQLEGLRGDFAVLIGRNATNSPDFYALPVAVVPEMNYDADVKVALTASYDLYFKQQTVDDTAKFGTYRGDESKAEDAHFGEQVDSDQNTHDAAKINYQAAELQFTQSFRKLYNAIEEQQRQLVMTEATVDLQKRLYDTAKLKFERGMISKNALQTAREDYQTALSTSEKAKLNLFSAVNQYKWAKNGVIGA